MQENKHNFDEKKQTEPEESMEVAPVVLSPIRLDEVLENELVKALLDSCTKWLIISAETSKIDHETKLKKVDAEVKIASLNNKDKSLERKYIFRENVLEKIYNLVLLIALTVMMVILRQYGIINDSVVQTIFIIIASLLVGGTDIKALIKKKRTLNRFV